MSITWKLSAIMVFMCCIKLTHKLNLFPLSQCNQSELESIPSGETRQYFDVAFHPGKFLTLTSLLRSSFPLFTKICNKKVTLFISCQHDEVFCSNPFGDTLNWAKCFEVFYMAIAKLAKHKAIKNMNIKWNLFLSVTQEFLFASIMFFITTDIRIKISTVLLLLFL